MKVAQWVKGIIAGIGGVAGVVVPLLDDGQISGAEWGTLAAAVLVAFGVLAAPNAVTARQAAAVLQAYEVAHRDAQVPLPRSDGPGGQG